MKFSAKIKYSLLAVSILLVVSVLHYYLPHTQVVQIIGTDVKRLDSTARGKTDGSLQEKGKQKVVTVRDVRFINAVSKSGKTEVFRNEDTGWGLPPYFKFNSADVTAQAQSFTIAEEKPWILVKYYGWRIHIFDMFPNVISLKQATRDHTNFPLFNIVFLCLLGAGGYYAVRRFRRLVQRIKTRFGKNNPAPDQSQHE